MPIDWDVESLIQDINGVVEGEVKNVTEAVADEAVKSIQTGVKSGRFYNFKGKKHQASAPGQSPANMSGDLVKSRRTEYPSDGNVGRVIFDVPYARALEYGKLDGKILPRPFIRPALLKKGIDLKGNIRKSTNRMLQRRKVK